jgi:predicted ester cyclase
MSEQDKALARRFYEDIMNKKRMDVIDELISRDYIDHSPLPGQGPGLQGLKDSFSMLLKAFPDLRFEIEQMVAEGDTVVTRFTGTGTHKGELMGAAPTGKKITIHGIDMFRVSGGKAVEIWHQGDDMMVMMQLGVRPPA